MVDIRSRDGRFLRVKTELKVSPSQRLDAVGDRGVGLTISPTGGGEVFIKEDSGAEQRANSSFMFVLEAS